MSLQNRDAGLERREKRDKKEGRKTGIKQRKKERQNKRNKECTSHKLGYPNYIITFWNGHNVR
jgi:hypothetical protein